MATSDFQVFGGGAGANVLSQSSYLALQSRVTGFQTGVAQSQQLNKVWRQSSIISAMIGQFICDYSGQNAVDDGTIATLEANFVLALQGSTRTKVPSTGTNLYVATTGNDGNNGLSSSTPFLTLEKAATVALQNYDTQGYTIVVNVASGTYTAGAGLFCPLLGGGIIQFLGNTSSPASVIVNLTSSGNCFFASGGLRMQVSGMSLGANYGSFGSVTGNCLFSQLGAQIQFNNVIFLQSQYTHMTAGDGGYIGAVGPYTISGGATYHIISGASGSDVAIFGQTVTLTGTPNFSADFVWADGSGFIGFAGSAFSPTTGGATGQKYYISNGGYVNTNGAGVNYLPGSTAGVNANGYYV